MDFWPFSRVTDTGPCASIGLVTPCAPWKMLQMPTNWIVDLVVMPVSRGSWNLSRLPQIYFKCLSWYMGSWLNGKDRSWKLVIDSRIMALLKLAQRSRRSRRVVAGDDDGDGAEGSKRVYVQHIQEKKKSRFEPTVEQKRWRLQTICLNCRETTNSNLAISEIWYHSPERRAFIIYIDRSLAMRSVTVWRVRILLFWSECHLLHFVI